MRKREQIAADINQQDNGIGLSEKGLMISVAILEVLIDIRDLLQQLQPPVITNQPPCDRVQTGK